MIKISKLFFTLLLFSLVNTIFSQEICDNGIDDDGDGRIDCYDGECSTDGACDDFFFGNVVRCADDIDVTTFAIRLQWASEDRSSNSHATPLVGDLDGNGIPEVIATNKQRKSVFVLNGATGATLYSYSGLSFQPENVPVIGDIDRNEFGEILVSQDRGDDLALFNHDLTFEGVTQPRWTAKASRNDAIGLPGFADFDEDGDVEIYYRNEIMDAATGNVIIAGTDIDWKKNFTHGSLAVDVLDDGACADCAGLELVSGNEIWSINESAGTRTLVRDMDTDIKATPDIPASSKFRSDASNADLAYYPKYFSNWDDQFSTVSAADYNLDGNMDLIISGALGTTSEEFNGETTVFFWDVANNTVTTFHDPSNNFVRGPGRVNIGDVDGDGQLNANFVMNQKLYSLDENFDIHWIRPIKEGSSGFTGCSLFDFDGDGAVEVVYRSEESLIIVDGIGNGDNTTNIRNEIACVSRTQEEYPVIADVDGDGASEICLSCYSNNNTPFDPYSNTEFAQVRVYESDGEAWMPARGVWNQHAYYNVNINDDLTIPIEVQDHTEVFSPAGTCEYADGSVIPFEGRPLNTFLNQAPILNENGCVEFASPDVEFVGILNATDAECPDATIEVTFQIRNIGDIAISGNLPVSYYAEDPRNATGSTYLDTKVTTLVNFQPETTIDIVQTITGIGGEFEIFVIINDNGTSDFPIEVPLPTSVIPECDTDNNIQSTNVGFSRFDLISEKINDNRKCDDDVPDNGSAQAYYFGTVPGISGGVWIENFEDLAISDKSDAQETAWTSDPGTESPGFYGVNSYKSSRMFEATGTGGNNDVGEVTWTSESIDISNHTDISVTIDLFEEGDMENSGENRDYIIVTYEIQDVNETVTASGEFTNGSQFGNFDYAQALITGINNAGQKDSLLSFTVTIHNTSTSESHYIDNASVQGTPISTPIVQTEADGFVFNWYEIGDTTDIIHTGSTISQLAEGEYIVEGYYGTTLCFSALDTIEILRTTPEVFVWSYEVSQETNCNAPDGSAFAFAYTETEDGSPPPATELNPPGDTLLESDGYSVIWRINGDITNDTIAVGNLLQNQTARDYAADIRDDFTGCFSTVIAPITANFESIQGLNTSKVDITTCGGSGTVSADVNGNTTDYSFQWYNGPSEKPSIDFIGVDYTVNDPGEYTVVARDNTTGCTSSPETVLVDDLANSPIVTASETRGNDDCGSNSNGVAEADVNAGADPNNFDFTWFLGNNTLAANELPGSALITATFGVGEWELTGLSTGIYTVIAEELATNCTDTTTVTITDDSIDPTFITEDAVLTPNTSCGSPNGMIETGAAITPSISYAFSLYRGATVNSADSLTTNSSGSFPGLAPGTYTIVAVDNTSECETAVPLTVTIDDEPDYPVISATPSPDAFCENGNGSIEVTSSSAVEPGSYTYEIFDGFNLTNEITTKSDITVGDGMTGHTFPSLADGNYRIRVTNDNLSCDSFVDVVVGDASEIPTFSTSRLINDNTSCDVANPNGFISVSIDEVGFNASNYTWEWYQGSTVDPDSLLANPETGEGADVTIDGYTIALNSLDNIPAGDYTVFARDNTTGCKTVDLTLTVNDAPVDIGATTTLLSSQTACSFGDGSVSVVANGTDFGAPCGTNCVGSDGFTFEWYFGNDTSDPLDDSDVGGLGTLSFNTDSTQVNGLTGGNNYTVLVRENSTLCFTTQTIFVTTDFDIPDANATTTPNSVCDDSSPTVDFNGTLTVSGVDDAGSINFSSGNYEIELFEGSGTSGPSTVQTSNIFNELEDGPYTVVITNTLNGCSSNAETFNVQPDLDDFSSDINAVANPQISCDLSSPLGQIIADVAGSTIDYTFQLFQGSTEITSNISSNSTSITFDLLASGSYRLVVTSGISGCDYDEVVVVQPNQVDPVLLNEDTEPNLRCSAPNGSLSFDVNAGIGADARAGGSYLAELFEGSGIGPSSTSIDTDTQAGPSSSFEFTGLSEGNYIIRVTDQTTNCEAISGVFTIAYEGPTIEIENAAITLGFPTTCFTNNGSIDLSSAIEIDNPDPTTSISIEWFLGGDTLSANEIPFGTFPFDLANVQNGGGTVASTNPVGTVNATGLILDQIPAISYTALIRLDNGCVELINISLPEVNPPTVTFTPTDPTDCSPSDGSLAIDITTNAGDFADNYQFTLYTGVENVQPDDDGISPYSPPITSGDEVPLTNFNSGTVADSEIINNLESGTYTVIVRRDPSSLLSSDECPVAILTFTLEEPPSPILTNLTEVNNTHCGDGSDGGIEYNGSFSLNATYNGSPEDMNFGLYLFDGANYTFIADNASPTAASVNGDDDFDVLLDPDADNDGTDDDLSITGLGELPASLSFAIIAESSSGTGCTDTVLFEILNDPVVISTSGIVENINDCTPGTGGFTVNSVSPDIIADYEFRWLDDPALTGTEITTLSPSKLDYTTAGDYYVIVRNTLNGCETRLDFTIEDTAEDPIIIVTQDANDTHCEPTTGTGQLTASVNTTTYIVTDYIFTWYEGDAVDPLKRLSAPVGADVNAVSYSISADGDVLSGLPNGTYTVTVRDNAGNDFGCESIAVTSVPELQQIPTLLLSDLEVTPDSLCGAPSSGFVIIEDADISPGNLDDYEIEIREGTVGGTLVNSYLNNGSPEINENLDAGIYFILAENTTTGCSISPVRVEIEDLTVLPLITLERLVSDQNCGAAATNAGEIEVRVDGSFDHNNSNYTFLWESEGGGALPVAVTDNEASLVGVPEGSYQVTVTNNNTLCDITRVYEVPNISIVPIILSTEITSNTNCSPDNGSFEVLEVIYDADTFETIEMDGIFELEVFRTSDNASQGSVTNSPHLVTDLSPDDYYAVVRHVASSCESEQVNFTIENLPDFPTIVLSLDQADSTCQAGFTPNAAVTALANGEDETNLDYTFQWYFGAATDIGGTAILLDGTALSNGSIPVGFNASTISGLAAGLYTIQVSQTSTGCVVAEEITIPNIPAEVEITSFDITPATNCFGNGIIDITGVAKDGLADDPANYIFEFYTENPENTTATPVFTVPTDGAIFDAAMGATTYFVVGTHVAFGCVTPAIQTQVQEDVERPVVELDDFDFQTNCDLNNPNGRLLVLADGQPDNDDYDFQWFIGTTATDSLTSDDYSGGQNLNGANTNEVFGLAAGFYTVVAQNNVTGCIRQATFEMTNLTPDNLEIATTASSNTSCEDPNGIVSASVLIGQNLEDEVGLRTFDYFWFVGTIGFWGDNPDTLQASFIGQTISGLPQGNYVVFAVDRSDGSCNSVAKQVSIDNDPIISQFELETMDVTVCFENKDGYAEVVMDDLSQVDITWFNDMSDSIGSGFFIDSLEAGLYGVTVTNRITQCPNSAVFEIMNMAVYPNDPFIIVNNGRNNCSTPNGSAIANVDGATNNFLFEWFTDPNDDEPYATGFQVNNLDSGTYFVRATDITTGCPSGFTSTTIDFQEIQPEFTVQVDNSICLRTEDGSTNQFTGSAIIVFEEFNLPTEYEWTYLGDETFQTEEVISRDSRLIDAFPGNYRVRFVAENGCEYFAEFSVDVTLNIYNGVSANDDGKNDFFLIDCIDYFPRNNVKIFNRAGQRVWEDDQYDNRNIRFEGTSNVGGGGLVLPSGTYFYLVDLGTGEDPIQGYLELVR